MKRLVEEDPEFYSKRDAKTKATKVRNGHSPNWHNAEQMVETRYKKNGGVWITEEQLASRRLTSLDKYGCDDPNKSEIVKEHKRQAFLGHYGVAYYFQTSEFKEYMVSINEQRKAKEFETKKRNNSFKSSRAEKACLVALQEKFGADDVLMQYTSSSYPFRCDFYIKSLDLYIELNEYWMHGKHFFDSANNDDLKVLESWKERAKTSKAYCQAIDTWTVRDPKKVATAVANGLRYLVFWSEAELLAWISESSLRDASLR